jgi:hypothetical protein
MLVGQVEIDPMTYVLVPFLPHSLPPPSPFYFPADMKSFLKKTFGASIKDSEAKLKPHIPKTKVENRVDPQTDRNGHWTSYGFLKRNLFALGLENLDQNLNKIL